MNTAMTHRLFKLACVAGTLAAGAAHGAVTCGLTASAPSVLFTGAVNNSSGTVTVTCTRDGNTNNLGSQTVYVGITPAAGTGRRLFRHGGGTGNGDRLDASLFKNNTTTDWADGSSAQRVNGTIWFLWTATASVTLDYDFRIPNQTGKTAGIYDAIYTANLRLSANGAVEASTTFAPTASVPEQCFIGQVGSGNTAPGAVSPSTLVLNYTSFSATPQTASMGFTVDCTLNTDYSLSISPASGTLVGLNYTLALDNGAATWTGRVGNGLAQQYNVTATIPANQAGTCATAACSGTRATTITITY